MNRETVKTFILVVLVGLSFLLSYILWSYQPKYEMFYDASYINEVDVGGKERTKQDLVKPSNIVFHHEEHILGFIRPNDKQTFFQEITNWELTNTEINDDINTNIYEEQTNYIEIIFPSTLSANFLTTIFSISEEVEFPNWSFERVYIYADENTERLNVQVYSIDNREQFIANIEKVGAYETIQRYDESHSQLQTYIASSFDQKRIYIPKTIEKASKKTLVANTIEPDSFINALFSNPSLVKPNRREAFFTDGQRGMRVFQDGKYLEFINPLQTNDDKLEPIELLDKSINNINEHKGWLNEYLFESIHVATGKVQFRLYYEGFPVYDFNNLTIMEQMWREQELHQYQRSLTYIGHLLNVVDVDLPGGEEVIQALQLAKDYDLEKISDIRLGYYLNYIEEAHSITLEPTWFMRYDNDWTRIPFIQNGLN